MTSETSSEEPALGSGERAVGAGRIEARQHRRVELSLRLTYTGEHTFYTGLSRNISEGGIFIASDDPLPLGSRITVNFALPGGPPIAVECEVRWSSKPNPADPDHVPGMGVQFLDLPEFARGEIAAFVARRAAMVYAEV